MTSFAVPSSAMEERLSEGARAILNKHKERHQNNNNGRKRHRTPRKCICDLGDACHGMSAAFAVIKDSRGDFVELPSRLTENEGGKESRPLTRWNQLRTAYLSHLAPKGLSNCDQDPASVHSSDTNRGDNNDFVALHHFPPRVIDRFFNVSEESNHDDPLPAPTATITEDDREKLGLSSSTSEKDRVRDASGRILRDEYFITPCYSFQLAHQDLKRSMRHHLRKMELAERMKKMQREARRRELESVFQSTKKLRDGMTSTKDRASATATATTITPSPPQKTQYSDMRDISVKGDGESQYQVESNYTSPPEEQTRNGQECEPEKSQSMPSRRDNEVESETSEGRGHLDPEPEMVSSDSDDDHQSEQDDFVPVKEPVFSGAGVEVEYNTRKLEIRREESDKISRNAPETSEHENLCPEPQAIPSDDDESTEPDFAQVSEPVFAARASSPLTAGERADAGRTDTGRTACSLDAAQDETGEDLNYTPEKTESEEPVAATGTEQGMISKSREDTDDKKAAPRLCLNQTSPACILEETQAAVHGESLDGKGVARTPEEVFYTVAPGASSDVENSSEVERKDPEETVGTQTVRSLPQSAPVASVVFEDAEEQKEPLEGAPVLSSVKSQLLSSSISEPNESDASQEQMPLTGRQSEKSASAYQVRETFVSAWQESPNVSPIVLRHQQKRPTSVMELDEDDLENLEDLVSASAFPPEPSISRYQGSPNIMRFWALIVLLACTNLYYAPRMPGRKELEVIESRVLPDSTYVESDIFADSSKVTTDADLTDVMQATIIEEEDETVSTAIAKDSRGGSSSFGQSTSTTEDLDYGNDGVLSEESTDISLEAMGHDTGDLAAPRSKLSWLSRFWSSDKDSGEASRAEQDGQPLDSTEAENSEPVPEAFLDTEADQEVSYTNAKSSGRLVEAPTEVAEGSTNDVDSPEAKSTWFGRMLSPSSSNAGTPTLADGSGRLPDFAETGGPNLDSQIDAGEISDSEQLVQQTDGSPTDGHSGVRIEYSVEDEADEFSVIEKESSLFYRWWTSSRHDSESFEQDGGPNSLETTSSESESEIQMHSEADAHTVETETKSSWFDRWWWSSSHDPQPPAGQDEQRLDSSELDGPEPVSPSPSGQWFWQRILKTSFESIESEVSSQSQEFIIDEIDDLHKGEVAPAENNEVSDGVDMDVNNLAEDRGRQLQSVGEVLDLDLETKDKSLSSIPKVSDVELENGDRGEELRSTESRTATLESAEERFSESIVDIDTVVTSEEGLVTVLDDDEDIGGSRDDTLVSSLLKTVESLTANAKDSISHISLSSFQSPAEGRNVLQDKVPEPDAKAINWTHRARNWKATLLSWAGYFPEVLDIASFKANGVPESAELSENATADKQVEEIRTDAHGNSNENMPEFQASDNSFKKSDVPDSNEEILDHNLLEQFLEEKSGTGDVLMSDTILEDNVTSEQLQAATKSAEDPQEQAEAADKEHPKEQGIYQNLNGVMRSWIAYAKDSINQAKIAGSQFWTKSAESAHDHDHVGSRSTLFSQEDALGALPENEFYPHVTEVSSVSNGGEQAGAGPVILEGGNSLLSPELTADSGSIDDMRSESMQPAETEEREPAVSADLGLDRDRGSADSSNAVDVPSSDIESELTISSTDQDYFELGKQWASSLVGTARDTLYRATGIIKGYEASPLLVYKTNETLSDPVGADSTAEVENENEMNNLSANESPGPSDDVFADEIGKEKTEDSCEHVANEGMDQEVLARDHALSGQDRSSDQPEDMVQLFASTAAPNEIVKDHSNVVKEPGAVRPTISETLAGIETNSKISECLKDAIVVWYNSGFALESVLLVGGAYFYLRKPRQFSSRGV